VPSGVSLRKVDLSIELQILAFYEQRKAILSEVRRGRRAAAPEAAASGADEPLGLARAGS
jgi:redox-sensing transcriptional repressor